MEMAGARVKCEAAGINQAGLPEVHLGNRCVLKATARFRLDAEDSGPGRIQNKEMSAGRIDGHPLRVLQAEVPGIVTNQRRRIQIPIWVLQNLNQLVSRGLKDEQTIELAIKCRVNRVPDPGSRRRCGLNQPDQKRASV